MFARLKRLQRFFVETIWKYNSSGRDKNLKARLLTWFKTLLIASRLFIKKGIYSKDINVLTICTLMALIPFLALMFVLAKGFGYDVMLEDWIEGVLQGQPVVAEYIVGFVHNYLQNTHSNYIIGIGLPMMLFTLYSLMQTIEGTFDCIWDAKGRSLKNILTDYTLIFFVCGLMILLSSGLNIAAVALTGNNRLLYLVAIIPLFIFFVFIYCFIPNTYVKLKYTIIPGFLAAVIMSIFQYFYIYAQVWLSGYNVIYGSLAAIPLFLLWMKYSWTICMFGSALCYASQNLHHYDYDINYTELKREEQIKVCSIIMQHICSNFRTGEEAYTAKYLHEKTLIPQQIINGAIQSLMGAKLIIEKKEEGRGTHEELSKLYPTEDISNLTFGTLVERLDTNGTDLEGVDLDKGRSKDWKETKALRRKYISEGKGYKLYDL